MRISKRKIRQVVLTATLLFYTGRLAPWPAWGAETGHSPTKITNTYAVIVSGINKDPNDRLAKEQAVMSLRKFFLNNVKIRSEQVCLLTAGSSALRTDIRESTADNLSQALSAFAAEIQPTDKFVFYYTGQANTVAGTLRLNLPGEDVTHQEIAEWINRIKTSSTMIVLDCPGAGLAVKTMKGKGRIIISGCEAEQHYGTKLSEYFVPALADPNSDTDGNGKVSVLEAFTLSCKQLEEWYRQRNLLKTETPLLEDDADGVASPQPWRYESDKADGFLASRFFLAAE